MNSHHHQEPEEIDRAIKMMRKYWFLPNTYQFTTEIRETDGDWIRLQENFFYPEGGGQPSDHGELVHDESIYQVFDVQERDNGVWLLVPDTPLLEGQEIKALIDKNRRITLTRNHSGQHLISAAFWEELDLKTTSALIGMEETEIVLDASPEIADITAILSLCQAKIKEKLPINSLFYDLQGIPRKTLRGELPADIEICRVVEIGNFDKNACGGTHVKNTGEIDLLVVTQIEGKKIKFTTGSTAKSNIPLMNSQLFGTSRLLGAPFGELSSAVSEIIDTKERYYNDLLDLKRKYTQLKVKSSKWQDISGIPLKIVNLEEINRGLVVELFERQKAPFVAIVQDQSNRFVLITHSSSLTQQLMEVLKEEDIKGGGRGKVVMGQTHGYQLVVNTVKTYLNQQ